MVFMTGMHSDSLQGMQKNKKEEVQSSQSSQATDLINYEEVRSKAKFGYFGTIAAYELIIKDQEKKLSQIEAVIALKSLMHKADTVDDYERIYKKAKEIVALDIGTLCFVFSDFVYKEYVKNLSTRHFL